VAGLDPTTHVFDGARAKDVDARFTAGQGGFGVLMTKINPEGVP
jgi:hypothetical protein